MMNNKFLMTSCLLVFLAAAAWPNSAPVLSRGLGGTDIVPTQNRQIRMVREVVNIECAWTTYTVKADFWFLNTTGKEQVIEFGFPIDFHIYQDITDNYGNPLEYDQFIHVTWQGKPVRFKLGKLQMGMSAQEGEYFRQWVCWTARFAPYEEVNSRVCYTYPTWIYDPGSENTEGYVYLKYILKTGSAWLGPIDSAVINLHYNHPCPYDSILSEDIKGSDGVPKASCLKIYPGGYVLNKEKRSITWEFRKFVPDKDIYFGLGSPPNFKRLDREQKIQYENIRDEKPSGNR